MAHRSCVLTHIERLIRIAIDEQTAGEDRMQNCHAQHATRDEDASKLVHGLTEVLGVHEHHEADDQISHPRRDWQTRRVCKPDASGRNCGARCTRECHRSIDADDLVSTRGQLARQTSLTTPDIEGKATGRRYKIEEAWLVQYFVVRIGTPQRDPSLPLAPPV